MTKLTVSTFLTLDGVMQAPGDAGGAGKRLFEGISVLTFEVPH